MQIIFTRNIACNAGKRILQSSQLHETLAKGFQLTWGTATYKTHAQIRQNPEVNNKNDSMT